MQNPVFSDNTTVTGDGTEEHPLASSGGGGGAPAGADQAIQFNRAGVFGGDEPVLNYDYIESIFNFVSQPIATSAFDVNVEGDGTDGGIVIIQGGPNGNMQLDFSSTFSKKITLENSEPASTGILVNDPVGAGISLVSVSGGLGAGISLVSVAGGFQGALRLVGPTVSMVMGGPGIIELLGDGITPTEIRIGQPDDVIGFFGAGGSAQPVVSGDTGANAALASLISALGGMGLIDDTTTDNGAPFDVPVIMPGLGVNTQVLAYIPILRNVTFPAGAANSLAVAKSAATASTTFTFLKNGVAFATVNFAIAATTGTWTQAADAVFAPNDILEVDGPAVADATLANAGMTLWGNRTS